MPSAVFRVVVAPESSTMKGLIVGESSIHTHPGIGAAKGHDTMATITETAKAFFEACETGKDWAGCSPYRHPRRAHRMGHEGTRLDGLIDPFGP